MSQKQDLTRRDFLKAGAKTGARLDTLVRIADVLQVTLDELAGRKDLKNPEFKIRNPRLHDFYRQIDSLSDEDQQALEVLLDSLIKRSKMGKVLAG